MPQIGWFELLVIIIVAILVIGPKDFPIVLRKIGTWVGSIKRYFKHYNILDHLKNDKKTRTKKKEVYLMYKKKIS